ncbi:cytochrome P450 [Backusella circina FSU 941]|nr:cytochrome P450 [Backusella circina FSU 941]
MSFLQNSFLEIPLENALKVYNEEILTRVSRKNQFIAIGAAVALTLVYKVRELMRPPKHLRHIPYFGYIDLLSAYVKEKRYIDIAYLRSLPLLRRPENKGIYVKPGKSGWEVHVTKPESVKRVFQNTDKFPKSDFFVEGEDSLLAKLVDGPNLLFVSGTTWKKQRIIVNPAFRRSMPVHLFGRLTQDLFQAMEMMESTVDWSDLMQRWTLDAIGLAGFGFDFHAIKDKKSEWVCIYESVVHGMLDPLYFMFPFLDRYFLWMNPGRQVLFKNMEKFNGMLSTMVEGKRASVKSGQVHNENLEENEKDLLTLLIEGEAKGDGSLTDEELKSNLAVFFVAGHDTTSNALAAAVYFLAKNENIQQRAREEAICILGDEPLDVLPNIQQTKEMKYINQVMKETMRIASPAPEVVPRHVTEDSVLADTFVPKGSKVVPNIYDTHHTDRLWDEPFTFNPDRFSEENEKKSNEAWVPFAGGGRQCIGMNFSLNEQRVVLSMLLRKFTFTLPENSIHKDRLLSTGMGVLQITGLDIRFERRY